MVRIEQPWGDHAAHAREARELRQSRYARLSSSTRRMTDGWPGVIYVSTNLQTPRICRLVHESAKKAAFADSSTNLHFCRLGVFLKSRLQTRLPSTVSKLVTTCLQMGRPIAISKDCTQRVSDPWGTSWPWQFRRFRGGFMAVSWRFQTVSNRFNRFKPFQPFHSRFSRFSC